MRYRIFSSFLFAKTKKGVPHSALYHLSRPCIVHDAAVQPTRKCWCLIKAMNLSVYVQSKKHFCLSIWQKPKLWLPKMIARCEAYLSITHAQASYGCAPMCVWHFVMWSFPAKTLYGVTMGDANTVVRPRRHWPLIISSPSRGVVMIHGKILSRHVCVAIILKVIAHLKKQECGYYLFLKNHPMSRFWSRLSAKWMNHGDHIFLWIENIIVPGLSIVEDDFHCAYLCIISFYADEILWVLIVIFSKFCRFDRNKRRTFMNLLNRFGGGITQVIT